MTESHEVSVHTLSGAYVVDALDDDEREQFEQHLPGCLDCQQEVASLREGAARLAEDAAVTPPPSLRANVLAGIRTIRPLPPEVGDDEPADEPAEPEPAAAEARDEAPVAEVVPLRRRFRASRLVAAAAAVAAIAAGGIVYEQVVDQGSTSTLSAADRILGASDVTHVSQSFADGSTATVFRSQSEDGAVLVTRRMAAPPSGKVFELWLQDAQGRMHPAGLMHGAGDQKILLKGPASQATGVGITVEPPGGSKQPTSEPIALFQLDKADT